MITLTHTALHKNGSQCIIDIDFKPLIVKFLDKAQSLGLKIYITSSFRKDTNVKGAIVTPAQMSCHLVAHAIDCNVIDGNVHWNSEKLKNPTGKVLELINYAESIGLRWGGRFSKIDPVHFDDGINIKTPMMWKQKYNLIHQ